MNSEHKVVQQMNIVFMDCKQLWLRDLITIWNTPAGWIQSNNWSFTKLDRKFNQGLKLSKYACDVLAERLFRPTDATYIMHTENGPHDIQRYKLQVYANDRRKFFSRREVREFFSLLAETPL